MSFISRANTSGQPSGSAAERAARRFAYRQYQSCRNGQRGISNLLKQEPAPLAESPNNFYGKFRGAS